MLAGLVRVPSACDPIDHLSAGRLRQRHLLDRLVAAKVLSQPRTTLPGQRRWALGDLPKPAPVSG
jgi:membrane carboxypeptidase/penicillin-binding protein